MSQYDELHIALEDVLDNIFYEKINISVDNSLKNTARVFHKGNNHDIKLSSKAAKSELTKNSIVGHEVTHIRETTPSPDIDQSVVTKNNYKNIIADYKATKQKNDKVKFKDRVKTGIAVARDQHMRGKGILSTAKTAIKAATSDEEKVKDINAKANVSLMSKGKITKANAISGSNNNPSYDKFLERATIYVRGNNKHESVKEIVADFGGASKVGFDGYIKTLKENSDERINEIKCKLDKYEENLSKSETQSDKAHWMDRVNYAKNWIKNYTNETNNRIKALNDETLRKLWQESHNKER